LAGRDVSVIVLRM